MTFQIVYIAGVTIFKVAILDNWREVLAGCAQAVNEYSCFGSVSSFAYIYWFVTKRRQPGLLNGVFEVDSGEGRLQGDPLGECVFG